MKRRVFSFVTALALCLNLFPAGAFAAGVGTGGGLCPHHPAHTDECGYASPVLEQECSHSHSDDCYTEEMNCVHEHTAECYPEPDDASGADEPVLCTHICTQDGGCVTQTLSCLHEHGDTEGNPGAPCRFVCAVCPIEDLISKLPGSVSARNMEQVQAQIQEIYVLYDELTGAEQQQVDLSPCADLLEQMDGLSSTAWSGSSDSAGTDIELSKDQSLDTPFVVKAAVTILINGHTLTGRKSSAIQVTETGKLCLTGGGKIVSIKGAGVEVQSGGFLSIADPDISVQSTMYALDIASGADVHLSAGTYRGDQAAIRTANGDFAALLEPGYIYFDAGGNRILPENMAAAKMATVGQCMDHSDKSCTHDAGTTTHTWVCNACGITGSEPCTFAFQQGGTGTCVCGNGVEIVVDERALTNLVYDGAIKPENVDITVTLTDSSRQELVKDTDYTVNYEPRKDAGEITITVTGITFNGTFTKTYTVSQDRPVLEWDTTANPVPVEVAYDGQPVEAGDLPPVKINILSTEDNLQNYLQYSHKKQGDADYTDGLPDGAGTYEVIVSLPKMQNFEAASSGPITLTIYKISPIVTAPAAVRPVYNGTEQELVTAGTLDPAAIADGLKIKFAAAENGTYSTTIPTDINAGEYRVWYKVEVTDNYTAVGPTEISDVEIQRRQINPAVELSKASFPYDGTKKEPKITVWDGKTVIDPDQYEISWDNDLTSAGTHKATIETVANGNYSFTATAQIEITAAVQAALEITGQPAHVYYGDRVTTLRTSGGTGNGTVKWSIEAGEDSAGIDEDSGVLTVKGIGPVTVKAERTVSNYGPVSAVCTITVEPKPVVAEVTVTERDYDGTTDATVASAGITALNGDVVEIDKTSITATFDSPAAGTGKTVTLDTSNAQVSGADAAKYTVSYPDTAKGTINPRHVDVTVTLSGNDLQKDDSAEPPYFYNYDGTAKNPNVTVTADDDSAVLTANDYDVEIAGNKNVGNATVTVTAKAGGNYTFTEAKAPFAIRKASAAWNTFPQGKSLTYDGTDQELVTAGSATGGTVVYSLERDGTYKEDIPKKTAAGTYTVYYMVQGDANHSDTALGQLTVKIGKNTVTKPIISLSQYTFIYNKSPQKPDITVYDDNRREIPNDEYTVTMEGTNGNNGMVNVDTYTVTITTPDTSNYVINGDGTANVQTFKILPADQEAISITGIKAQVYYGDPIQLDTTGGTGNGTVTWKIEGSTDTTLTQTGLLTVKDVNTPITVTATRSRGGNYGDVSATWVFTAGKKPVTPVVTIKPKNYDGNTTVAADAITVTVRSSDLVSGDSITINNLEAVYDSANAGTNRAVRLNHSNVNVSGTRSDRYAINWPDSVTGTIDRVDAKLAIAPSGADLTYSPGTAQNLIAAGTGTTENNIGTVEYSMRQDGVYSTAIPVGTNAGTYTVWYKVAGTVNYNGISAASIEVEIKKADPVISIHPTASGTEGQTLNDIELSGGAINGNVPGKFTWKDGSIKPGVGTTQQYIVFTPDDTANYNTVEFQINVTVQAAAAPGSHGADDSGSSTSSTPARTTVQSGTASIVVSAAEGDKLVKEAIKSQSRTIVIKPEITGDVTKTRVSIPASTLSQIRSETTAALTVSTPVADATIPHGALDTLSRAGGGVSVAVEQEGQSVTLALTAGGETVEQIPGGLTLTVPAEDAGPGTVAVLVHDDGTREILQRSMADNGRMSIPLDGSATVEIVDNGKAFNDVPPTSWAAEAVTFACARELFSGTGEATFSPDETMSRAMLATVLYRLEGQPEQALTNTYSDVSDDAWYADSVAWAVENGIVNGYGDGQFGPSDSVTREQFVVMLWRYMGSPEAADRDLAFRDTDQVSSYALEALCWAVENGVLKGNGSGQLVPGGTATRAEAAQMLKNFMENT